MSVVRYTAKRSLTGGASAEDTIVRDLQLFDLIEGRQATRSESVALGGQREYVYDRGENTWQAIHKPIQIGSTQELQLRMFLDSVESGEVFEFAPYDLSTDSPINYRNVQITSDGWNAQRFRTGVAGGGSDYVQVRFSFVEVP